MKKSFEVYEGNNVGLLQFLTTLKEYQNHIRDNACKEETDDYREDIERIKVLRKGRKISIFINNIGKSIKTINKGVRLCCVIKKNSGINSSKSKGY